MWFSNQIRDEQGVYSIPFGNSTLFMKNEQGSSRDVSQEKLLTENPVLNILLL
jgi:hypothetical protein